MWQGQSDPCCWIPKGLWRSHSHQCPKRKGWAVGWEFKSVESHDYPFGQHILNTDVTGLVWGNHGRKRLLGNISISLCLFWFWTCAPFWSADHLWLVTRAETIRKRTQTMGINICCRERAISRCSKIWAVNSSPKRPTSCDLSQQLKPLGQIIFVAMSWNIMISYSRVIVIYSHESGWSYLKIMT